MSGFGIGITVGLGIVIGAMLGLPDPPPFELILGFIVYSLMTWALIESCRYMFLTWKDMPRPPRPRP